EEPQDRRTSTPLMAALGSVHAALLRDGTRARRTAHAPFLEQLDIALAEPQSFRVAGVQCALANIAALLDFRGDHEGWWRTPPRPYAVSARPSSLALALAPRLNFDTLERVLARFNDDALSSTERSALLPFLHVFMSFVASTIERQTVGGQVLGDR